MFNIGQESVNAQLAQKISSQTTDGIRSDSTASWETTFCKNNTSGLYQPAGWVPFWIDVTEKTAFNSMTINDNYYDLLNNPFLFNSARINLARKSSYITGYGNSGTFNGKWERLTGKPLHDTTSVYFYPLKRINAPTLTDNNFYRLTGNIFNMLMDMKYPTRNAPK
jgi:hypothetical protein